MQQVKKKFGQFTWMTLGICFVLLYSCPVKKFLIIYFGKSHHPVKEDTLAFSKETPALCVQIVFLSRDSSVYTVKAPLRALGPGDPLLSGLSLNSSFRMKAGASPVLSGPLPARLQTDDGDPLYLRTMNLRI